MNSKTVTAARWVSLVAAFVVGAVAEWKLGRAVHWDPYTAALIPLTLDVWGFAAFKLGRTWHVFGALVAMFGTQMVSHLLELGGGSDGMVALSIAVSAIAPAVSLACHRLGHEAETVDAPAVDVDTSSVFVDGWPHTPGYTVDRGAETYGERVYADATRILAEVTPDVAATVNPSPVVSPAVVAEYVNGSGAVVAESIVVDTADDELSTVEIARRAAELIANGYTKSAAAAEIGKSRQWVHKCMVKHGYATA